uniref:FTH domain-containing protein n=1 Tax=Steinernema glaseri TaxID=37863 RepID=A0A1I7ZQ69_9BILA
MDTVPPYFIDSVMRSLASNERPWNTIYVPRSDQQELSGRWGRFRRKYRSESGGLEVIYAPDLRTEWKFYYKLHGFDHIKTRTLSPEVVKEMSKSISSFKFSVKQMFHFQCWSLIPQMHPYFRELTVINPDDEEKVVRLLTWLDAPIKCFDASHFKIDFEVHSNLVEKHPHFLQSFTSVKVRSLRQSLFLQLVQRMTFRETLQSIHISSVPERTSTNFLVDYFFSQSCRRLTVDFPDFHVVRNILSRWKTINPRGLAAYKIFEGVGASPADLNEIGIIGIPISSIKVETLTVIEQKVVKRKNIKSIHRINHPVDKRSKIYLVSLGPFQSTLLFV